ADLAFLSARFCDLRRELTLKAVEMSRFSLQSRGSRQRDELLAQQLLDSFELTAGDIGLLVVRFQLRLESTHLSRELIKARFCQVTLAVTGACPRQEQVPLR